MTREPLYGFGNYKPRKKFWTTPYSYVAIDGKTYETTTLRELKIALVATPFVLLAVFVAACLVLVVMLG